MICFQKIMLTKQYSDKCNFTMTLSQKNYTFNLTHKRINEWNNSSKFVIIDNTPFPFSENGSKGLQDLNLSSSYFISIDPSNTYFFWMEICNIFLKKNHYFLLVAITMGICLFIIFIIIIILYLKTKKIKELNVKERLVVDGQNIKTKGKETKNSRKERINYDDRDLDFKMEKSNSIIINKSIIAEMKDKKILEFQ